MNHRGRHSFIQTYRHELVLLGLNVTVLAIAAFLVPDFLALKSQLFLSRQLWEMALLAIPMTMIILTGGIDLSVGSTMGLCAASFGLTLRSTGSIGFACAASCITGVLCGSVNGLFITRWKLHPLIVTLATYAAFRGMAEGLTQGQSISGFPQGFSWPGRGQAGGLPPAGWAFVVFSIGSVLFLSRTVAGRNIYAVGLNRRAAVYAGVPVASIEFLLYAFSGLMAGLATIVYVSRFNTAKADAGSSMELDVITAVVVGGTSIFGGRGTIPGTVLGLILIHETRLFVGRYWQIEELKSIIVGLLLILSVLVHRLRRS
jgi:rhamnose transport system permease protein